MSTKLTHEIRREIEIDGEPYTVVISPQGLRLSRKRFRSGRRLSWRALLRQGVPEDGTVEASPMPGGAVSV